MGAGWQQTASSIRQVGVADNSCCRPRRMSQRLNLSAKGFLKADGCQARWLGVGQRQAMIEGYDQAPRPQFFAHHGNLAEHDAAAGDGGVNETGYCL